MKMGILSRDFTLKEKFLIVILLLILLGFGYYWFVDQPVRRETASAQAETTALKQELGNARERIKHLKNMQSELDWLGSLDAVSRMGSYSNNNAELAALDQILSAAKSYSVSASGLSRSGDQVRRNFSLQFTVAGFADAKEIVTQLTRCHERCMVGDLHYTGASGGPATVSTTVTFFETMFDGVADSNLPRDSGG